MDETADTANPLTQEDILSETAELGCPFDAPVNIPDDRDDINHSLVLADKPNLNRFR